MFFEYSLYLYKKKTQNKFIKVKEFNLKFTILTLMLINFFLNIKKCLLLLLWQEWK
jgi:hypothetical protein